MKTKKIVEIKRGENVPTNAKWLKDTVKISYGNMPACDCHYLQRCSCEPLEFRTIFDVFEIQERAPNENE